MLQILCVVLKFSDDGNLNQRASSSCASEMDVAMISMIAGDRILLFFVNNKKI
jgi:hypothetical protein